MCEKIEGPQKQLGEELGRIIKEQAAPPKQAGPNTWKAAKVAKPEREQLEALHDKAARKLQGAKIAFERCR